jgi:hypothetical protein
MFQDKVLPSQCKEKWNKCKEGQRRQQKRQLRGFLVFSELLGLPSAGSEKD